MDNDRTARLRQLELVQKADAEWQTRAARHGFLRRLEREADLEHELGEEERLNRALELHRDYMREVATKSAAARWERADRLDGRSARRGGTNQSVIGTMRCIAVAAVLDRRPAQRDGRAAIEFHVGRQ